MSRWMIPCARAAASVSSTRARQAEHLGQREAAEAASALGERLALEELHH